MRRAKPLDCTILIARSRIAENFSLIYMRTLWQCASLEPPSGHARGFFLCTPTTTHRRALDSVDRSSYLCSFEGLPADAGRPAMVTSNDPMHDQAHCPHIDRGDSRCNHRFTLHGVEEAFAVCCGGQHGCATFHRLNMELAYGTVDAPKSVVRKSPALSTTSITVSAVHARNLSIRKLGA